MKTNFLFTALLSLFLLACSSDEAKTKSDVIANTTSKMLIDGMTCEVGCAGAIEKKLNKTAGVKNCDIDFESKIATIEFDNATISELEIKEIIENINDGQYKASIHSLPSSSDIESSSKKEDISVSITQIEIPNIFSALRSIL